MKFLLFALSVLAFVGATLLFIEGEGYGALGWVIAGGYMLEEAIYL